MYEEYFLLTNSRLEDVFSKATYKEKFEIDFEQKYTDRIKLFSLSKYFDFSYSRVKLTD